MWLDVPITGRSLPPKTLSLTFDDGPARASAGVGSLTVELARFLAERRVPATFFVVGKHACECPRNVDLVRQMGNRIGNHSYNHWHLTGSFLSQEEIVDEVAEVDAYIGAGSDRPILFRPPYGAWSPRLAYVLNENTRTCRRHVGPINWDIGSFDFDFWSAGKSAESCATRYQKAIARHPGRKGIVLFHDASADQASPSFVNKTFEMIQILVPRLMTAGYSFVELGAVPEIQNLLERERQLGEAALPIHET